MSPFTTLEQFRAALAAQTGPAHDAIAAAEARNAQLNKPPGALGRLEEIAIWYAGWRGQAKPVLEAPQVIVFAGNHGIAAQGVSAFPAEVTEQMVLNFQHGGAAINQLSQVAGAMMSVHALDLDTFTADFTQSPAMTEDELCAALQTGWDAVSPDAGALVVCEMGIGNTTPAAALCHALFGGEAADWTGRGTGVDDSGLANKTRVVAEGVARHQCEDGLDALKCLGGRELAAMAGAIARARDAHIPVILDGFICCAAAACLEKAQPGALDHTLAGHLSPESGHEALLKSLDKEPLLSLNMRLGEGSGGALALNILKAAVACHSGMETFAEAGVSEG